MRRGSVWSGVVGFGKAWHGKAGIHTVLVWQGKAWRGGVWQGAVGQGTVGRGRAWYGLARWASLEEGERKDNVVREIFTTVNVF